MLDVFVMTQSANKLPDDISQLKAIIAEQLLRNRKFEESISEYEAEIAHRCEELAQVKADNER